MTNNIHLIRTDSTHDEFVRLVSLLDAELAVRDGDEHDFYHQFNSITNLQYVVIAFENNKALGCGAFKMFDPQTVEIKRMYTAESARGKGIASQLLTKLESWALELGYEKCILETGINQPEALSLYAKMGYKRIPNYAQYKNKEMSRCFEKDL